ncbi:MAG: hypothetical protein GXP62_01230, partial [Oligoflexia bacterium]|nr:hypothetical protein [Oligoflexia bacterium]
SFFLTEHLASHGFIVVAPDHTYNTLFDQDDSQLPDLIFRRPVDISDTFDALLARNADPTDRLYGCIDPDAGYGVAGHSFGGFTTLAVAGASIDTDQVAAWCSKNGGWLCDDVAEYAAAHPEQTVYDLSDDRAWAAVAMAPAAYETLRSGLPSIALPTLILAGSMDTVTPWDSVVKPIWQDLSADPRAAGLIEGAGHYSFSNACDLVSTFADCSDPYLAPAEVQGIAKTVTLAWLQLALGQTEALAWLPPDDTRLTWETP